MSGYNLWSKSNNAIGAERRGEYPASKIARKFGLSVPFILNNCSFAKTGWHHTSKYYNITDYYDSEMIGKWINNDPEMIKEAGASYSECSQNWGKSIRKTNIKYLNCTVKWLEWIGTRSHPHPVEREENNCLCEDRGGKFVLITFPNGQTMKKKKDTNGFEVLDKEGKRILDN